MAKKIITFYVQKVRLTGHMKHVIFSNFSNNPNMTCNFLTLHISRCCIPFNMYEREIEGERERESLLKKRFHLYIYLFWFVSSNLHFS